ncbi:MAG: hypothetical protein E7117_07585 [Bacteroidales bacterium]|nr:hypothetical protein [Bacteroidales bacterium]
MNFLHTQRGGETDRITLSLSETELVVPKGQYFQLQAIVDPEGTPVTWESDDAAIVRIDKNGRGMAFTLGQTVVRAVVSEEVFSECVIKVIEAPEVGSFYYSDGTWSVSLDPDKNVAGVVFWVGDPTLEDAALKQDHPHCTHGLVVALNHDQKGYNWQTGYEAYGKTVGEWIEANVPEYVTVTSPWNHNENVNAIRGYNNTKAIEAFNAAEENAAWPVDVVRYAVQYRSINPAPETSSDWYIPSVKECALLIVGEFSGDVLALAGNIYNKAFLDYKLSLIDGSTPLGRHGVDDDIWSSNERDSEYVFYMSTFEGKVWMNWKEYGSEHHQVRCILAF